MVFLKFLTAIQLAVVLITSNVVHTTEAVQPIRELSGHIEVIGDMLTADTQDPSLDVEEVVLSGTVSYTLPGCSSDRCSYNIRHVNHGTYEATLVTSAGDFIEIVVIK